MINLEGFPIQVPFPHKAKTNSVKLSRWSRRLILMEAECWTVKHQLVFRVQLLKKIQGNHSQMMREVTLVRLKSFAKLILFFLMAGSLDFGNMILELLLPMQVSTQTGLLKLI